MRILWKNIVVTVLATIALILLLNGWPHIQAAFASLREIGPGHGTPDKAFGLIVLGMLGACLVAVVKILSRPDK